MTNVADAILNRLDGGRLWRKGDYGDVFMQDTSVCLLGAFHSVNMNKRYGFRFPVMLEEVIREQFPSFSGHIPSFNDDPETTWEDVRMVLEKASMRFEEMEGWK